MPYWKDAPSVKPEVFLSLSAPFRLLRADHYRLGRECRDNEEDDAGCGERDNTHDRCGDDGDKSRDNGREERERERLFCAQCQGRRATHTRMDTGITS